MVNRREKITELSKTIHHLNKGKAAGIDQFSGEMLKGGGRSKHGSYTVWERNEIKIKWLRQDNRFSLYNIHSMHIVAQLNWNFTKCTNTQMHHGNILYIKKTRHVNAKIWSRTRQRKNRENYTAISAKTGDVCCRSAIPTNYWTEFVTKQNLNTQNIFEADENCRKNCWETKKHTP